MGDKSGRFQPIKREVQKVREKSEKKGFKKQHKYFQELKRNTNIDQNQLKKEHDLDIPW